MKFLLSLFFRAALIIGVVSYPLFGLCRAQTDDGTGDDSTDFTKFSLEELKDVVIVSVSKKPETLSDAAAAVHVITREDIRRSGVTSIPEALRLAPGVHVARISATDWAINIRGLNGKFAQNLLVMIDGRSVYTHVFSGVFWDIQDTVIEDIDRIEVIRGPGAAVWGANAVNGVINIITRQAAQTKGWQTVALAGNKEQSASVRYGGTMGEQGGDYRAYAKFFNRGALDDVRLLAQGDATDPNDAQSNDNWRSGRGGFRIDLAPDHGLSGNSPDSYTFQGETYSNRYDTEFTRGSIVFPGARTDQTLQTGTSEAMGWHVLGRWQHALAADSETVLQLYYDHTQKDYDPASGHVNTADLDFQHRVRIGEHHEVVWGLEYKYISDAFTQSDTIEMSPSDMDQNQWSTFIQDEIRVVPDRLTFIAGSKFEYNDFTGLEIQPSLRALYTPDPRYSLWAAVSRAVRVPSRLELHSRTRDMILLPDLDPDTPFEIVTWGDSGLESEKLTAYELGLRLTPTPSVWVDTAVFYNDYNDLINLELIDSVPSEHYYYLVYDNTSSGEAYGLEMALDWKVLDTWLLSASYTYLHTMLEENDINDPYIAELISQDSNPQHSFSIRSNLDITPRIEVDLWLRYVGRLPERDIDSYTVLDARLAWRPKPQLELSLVGQNLLESVHSEFSTLEVERSIYAKIDWKF